MARHTDVQYIRFYTEGNAARKVEPVAPLKTMKLPKIKQHKRVTLYVDPMEVAAIVMSVIMAVLMVVGAVRLINARQEMATMSQYVQTLQEENVQLQQSFEEGYNLEEIQRTATALGMIPKEQAQHVSLKLPEFQEPVEPTAWERVTTFLAGLFA